MARWFLALAPGDEAREHVARFLRDRAPALLGPTTRTVRPENLHLTVFFLGDPACLGSPVGATDDTADDGPSGALDAALEPVVASTCPIRCRIAGLGTFPGGDRRPVRVVFAGLGDGEAAVRDLTERTAAALAPLLPPETWERGRTTHPHWTLGRARGTGPRRAPLDPGLRARLRDAPPPDLGPPFTIGRLILYRSDSGPHGVAYEAVASWPFVGPR